MLARIVGDRVRARKRIPGAHRREACRAPLFRLLFAGRNQVSYAFADSLTPREECDSRDNTMRVWQSRGGHSKARQPNPHPLQPPERDGLAFQNAQLCDTHVPIEECLWATVYPSEYSSRWIRIPSGASPMLSASSSSCY